MQLAILSIFLFAFFNHAADSNKHFLAQKIEFNSFSGLEETIEITNTWYNYKNKDNKSIIEMIIKKLADNKNQIQYINILKKIINKKDILVSDEELSSLLNLIKFKPYKNNQTNKKQINLAKELILAACKLEQEQENSIQKMSSIMSLFGLKISLAKALVFLYDKNLIINNDLNKFLHNYNDLFFSDKMPSKKTFYFLFKEIKNISDNKFLFEFALNFYEKKHDNFIDTQTTVALRNNDLNMLAAKEDCSGANINTVAEIMTYLDITDYAQALPKKVFNLNNTFLENIKIRQEEIRNFVIDTILFAHNKKDKTNNYIYWVKIYENLKNRGNLQGAFNIALALYDSRITERFNEIDSVIIDHTDNYKYYRDLEAQFKYNVQPSIVILQKDIISMKEAFKLACSDNKLEDFFRNNIDIYVAIKDKINKIYIFNKQFDLTIENSLLINMFKNPINKKDINFIAYYAFLMPKPSISHKNEYNRRRRSYSSNSSHSLIYTDNGQKKIEYRVENKNELRKLIKTNSFSINTANFCQEQKTPFALSPRRKTNF